MGDTWRDDSSRLFLKSCLCTVFYYILCFRWVKLSFCENTDQIECSSVPPSVNLPSCFAACSLQALVPYPLSIILSKPYQKGSGISSFYPFERCDGFIAGFDRISQQRLVANWKIWTPIQHFYPDIFYVYARCLFSVVCHVYIHATSSWSGKNWTFQPFIYHFKPFCRDAVYHRIQPKVLASFWLGELFMVAGIRAGLLHWIVLFR